MKSAHLTRKNHFEVVDIPEPDLQKGQVLVAMKAVGICASDIHYYIHGAIGNQICAYPQVLGHECAGIIARAASGSSLHEGDRVAVDPGLPCLTCEHCASGHFNLCPRVIFLGMPRMPGAFQEYTALSVRQVHRIPDAMTMSEAALLEPLGVAYHANNLASVRHNETVAVFGAGAVGLLTLAVAKTRGAGRTFVFDKNDYRLAAAKNYYRADSVANVNNCDPLAFLAEHTHGRGVDVVFEAAGEPESIEWAFESARIGGRVMLIGIPAQDRITFNAHSLRRRELLVQNVRRSNVGVDHCVDLVKRGPITLGPLATHRFPLERITDAFEIAAAYRDNVIRAMITF
jgi:L-iditol 2-dehydrogenase